MGTARHSLIILSLALLASCTSAPVAPPVNPSVLEADAAAALRRGDLEAAAALYRRLIAATTGTVRNGYLIDLAGTEVQLGRPEAALTTLAGVRDPLPVEQSAAVAAVRANAFFALGRTAEAVRLLVEREIWLDSSEAILANQNLIWNGLSLDASQAAARTPTGDPTIDGWLALAPLARMGGQDPDFVAGLIEWQSDNRGHPASQGILRELLGFDSGDGSRPARVALLLPLSSPDYRGPALAIRDGFIAAHLESGYAERTDIVIYDTSQRGAVASYQAAQVEGAEFIVGPLLTSDVEQVQGYAGLVPTLALNLAPATAGPSLAPSGLYQFALSSDDEIEAIAAGAIAAGHETAVVLHELSANGFRVRDNFAEAFQARGGRVINTAGYESSTFDHETEIESLLNITQSNARYTRLQSNLNVPIEFEPRRRTDIDMIFLQASQEQGRLIVPQLCLYSTDGIPTYAMSVIHGGSSAESDDDLDSIMFPALPIVVQPAGLDAAQALNQFTAARVERDQRLFAFGYDAYALIDRIYAGSRARWPMAGATGEMYVDPSGRIRRMLPFAQFRRGRPEPANPSVGLSCVE